MSSEALRRRLGAIDGRGYPAYKELRGRYDFSGWALHIDHVQGDPFARPSRMRLRVPHGSTGIPSELYSGRARRIALADFLARAVDRAIPPRETRGSGRSGAIRIDAGGQEILERTAVVFDDEAVEARIEVGLPASGRRVLGTEADELLCRTLPDLVERALTWSRLDATRARAHVMNFERHREVQGQLAERGLVAFVADGAVLPRRSGASNEPMREAIPFRSPPEMRVTLLLSDGEEVSGMAIPEGVTLIVGGGYHGKSTLLHAIERAVYPHVPGDGRDLVVTRHDAVKIRSEDGRAVSRVDIRPFLSDLPDGSDTQRFSTSDASGSTSQAASIVEALEMGATALLLDEDTSATNFMVRDARMQALVPESEEPIVPFVDRVRELYDRHGVSTVLVMGGLGDYFEPADNIIQMSSYVPHDVTTEARRVAERLPTRRLVAPSGSMPEAAWRRIDVSSLESRRGNRAVHIDARGPYELSFGREKLDLRAVEQLVDESQTRAAGYAVVAAARQFATERVSLGDMMRRLDSVLDARGLDTLSPEPGDRRGNLARPRRYEVAAVMNRLRSLDVESVEET